MGLIMPQTAVEICQSCRREIGPNETPCLSNGKVLCAACWSIANGAPPPVPIPTSPKIDGWLLLPALGMILGPLVTLSSYGELSMVVEQFRESGRLSQFPGAELLAVFVLVVTVLLVIVQVYAAVAFFKKRRSVPKMMVNLYVV